MRPSERLFQAGMPIWETYFNHPFVQGLGSGELPKEKFRYYLIQDHKYLMQYAKVFALGVFKAQEEADMRLYSDLIVATLDTENAIHQAYLAEMGVSAEDITQTPMALNNKSYTDYMIAEASKGGLPEIAAAVLACSWSYKVIGDYLEKMREEGRAPKENFYSRWIDMYSSPEFSAANDVMIDQVDRYCAGLSEEQLQRLEQIVIDCSYYEYQFWDMAWSEGENYTAF